MISENVFKCEVCDYNTKYKSDLVKHIRTHTKRPYICSECEYSAASIYYIYYFISWDGYWLGHLNTILYKGWVKSTELKIYGYYYHNTRHVCVSKNFSKLFRSILRAKRAKYRRKGFDKFLCCVSVSVLFRRKIHIDCLCDCTPPSLESCILSGEASVLQCEVCGGAVLWLVGVYCMALLLCCDWSAWIMWILVLYCYWSVCIMWN